MKIRKSDFGLLREAERNGLVVSMTGLVKPVRTELNNKLSGYFRNHMPNFSGNYDEEQSEGILDGINEYIQENSIEKHEIDFPITEGVDIHLLPITENLQLKVLVADEYFGDGDYAKYVIADSFVINENTTTKDVDVLIEFATKYLSTT